ncbi:MAG TPA: hypothetical protein PK453_13800, partial [Leptospiraceae bacterium]|nr:hypothetical protein [Leptospiraceae bacterium]
MICIKCNTFHRGFAGRLCPVCSEPLQFETEKNRNRLILGKFREYAELWQKKGLISKSSASEINFAVNKELEVPSIEKSIPESSGLTELFFGWLRNLLTAFFSGFAGIIEPEEKSYSKYIHTSDRKRKRADSGFDSVTESAFGEEGEKFSGIDAVSDLDRKRKSGG